MQDVATKSERGRRIGQAVADTGKAVGTFGIFLLPEDQRYWNVLEHVLYT